ncbi:MAG: RagB/SusD family nutrient uptake outer membrane protein [Paludibacteraceae bacterium]|nr:RagB/SusD family nutrient uptake outer membrane protein [Paludibacteraceae bacterium]
MNKKIFYILALAALVLSGCGFLDQEPDNRTAITKPEQVKKLLASAYSDADFAWICEFSSDNIVDNNSEDGTWRRYNLGVNKGESENEAFAWKPTVSASSNDGDSPVRIWSGAYKAIAVANHALEAMDQIEAKDSTVDFSEMRAEAYLCRAYNHFVLANIFCMPYRDSALSTLDLGVPYMRVPERVVYSNADRGTLTELYANIENDLLEGLKHVSDNYDQPKYHFNKQAAYAFATRFYLYKRDYDKVIEYATMALGSNPMSCMRTEYWSKSYSTQETLLFAYSNTNSPNNFLLTATYSTFYRSLNGRYACNRQASRGSIYGQGPTWQNYTFHPCYQKVQGLYLRGSQDYGLFYVHTGEYFEYTDKVAGIGYVHNVNPTFTGEETLLCRAEAYIMKKDYVNALADLKVWDDSRKVGTTEKLPDLTQALIEGFYTRDISVNGTRIYRIPADLHCSDLCPDWVIDTRQKVWLYCVLHFRRLETIHQGLRWFDIKRFGIEIRHKQGLDPEQILTWDDYRRAIEIPSTVIEAGMQPNLRSNLVKNDAVLFTGSCTDKPSDVED